jgi:hypothetical protein
MDITIAGSHITFVAAVMRESIGAYVLNVGRLAKS